MTDLFIALLLGGIFAILLIIWVALPRCIAQAVAHEIEDGGCETAAVSELRREHDGRVAELFAIINREVDRRRVAERWADALHEAGSALYYAGRWSCDRPADEPALWTALRDALGLAPGTATAAGLGFDEDHRVERKPARRGSVKRSHRAEGRNFVD